jgi:hemolysin III
MQPNSLRSKKKNPWITHQILGHRLSLPEETANLLTHGLGLVLSIAGCVILLTEARQSEGDFWQFFGCAVYAFTLVALYAASTLSHSFKHPPVRHFFRSLDQVCIFLLIAGNYTPFAIAYLMRGWWWALLVAVWGMALFGIVLKIFFKQEKNVGLWFYIVLGWLPVIGIKPIIDGLPTLALAWIVAGGLSYSLGTVFLAQDRKYPYFHAVWHLLVIAGSACHFIVVAFYVIA